jgi:hypothetical protein
MNTKILSALGTLMLLSTVAGATLLPGGQSGQLSYKQDRLCVSIQQAKANGMSEVYLDVIIPRRP